jgi:hypothetical protein
MVGLCIENQILKEEKKKKKGVCFGVVLSQS